MAGEVPGSPAGAVQRFERSWQRGWQVLPYALFSSTRPPAPPRPGDPPVGWWPAGPVILASVAWHTWFVPRHPEWLERRAGPMVLYLAGYLAAAVLLTGQHPAFLLVLFGAYPMAFVTLPGWWAHVGVLATSVCLLLGLEAPAVDIVVQIALATAAASGIGGAIRALERESTRRAEVSERLARALARNAELHAELLAHARDAAVIEERARLSRDLHDTLAQTLVAISTHVQLADAAHESTAASGPGGGAARREVRTIGRLARSGLVETRRVVAALGPEALGRIDLLPAIEAALADWTARTRRPADLVRSGDLPPLPDDVEAALLRVLQEALANVERHAGATAVTVTISRVGDTVALDVHDRGRGFDPATRPSGTGRRGMSARMAAVGGSLTVESGPDAGTTVNATVVVPHLARPLPAAGAAVGPT